MQRTVLLTSVLAVFTLLAGCVTGHPRMRPTMPRTFESVAVQAQSPAPSTGEASQSPHPAGSSIISTQVYYSIPILQKSFFWDGNGEVDNSGIGGHVIHYLGDGVGLGLGLNLTNWWTGGRDVQSAELEGRLRVHPVDSWPVFIEGSTGFQYANDQIPPGGTFWNFSFGFGGGAEFPVSDHTRFQCGAFYHHISNALGRENLRNPSQNEARIWVGFSFDL